MRQSVTDILTTPIGTRVMRRDYGSRLWELVDTPLTPGTLSEIYAAASEALGRWETRLRVERIRARRAQGSAAGGHVLIDLEGEYLPDGEPVRLEGIVI